MVVGTAWGGGWGETGSLKKLTEAFSPTSSLPPLKHIPDTQAVDGATFAQARRDKERKYPELAAQGLRMHFIVAATEVGGRCNAELVDLVRQVVAYKASQFAPSLQPSMRAILARRYWGILSVATQRAVAQCAAPVLQAQAAAFPIPTLETLMMTSDAL